MGSGTTSIVAKKKGRNSIGIEIMPEYFEYARKTIGLINVNLVRLIY